MKRCITPECGSHAINHGSHGRDGNDLESCDVCYWRNREANAKAGARYTADLCTQALNEVRRLHKTRIALTHIADAAEDHPAYMGDSRSSEDLEKEGGDAAKITEIAYTARAALAQIGEQA